VTVSFDTTRPPRAGSGFATRRLYRVMTMGLASAAILEFASVLPTVLADRAGFASAYTIFAIAVIVAPACVALCLFSWAPLPALRWIWRGAAIGMLVAYAAIPFGLDGPAALSSGPTWMGELEVIAGCAGALGWRVRGAIAYAIVLQSVVFTNALIVDRGYASRLATGDAIRQLFYLAMFMCLVAAMMRAGRILDATVDDAVAEARAAADAERRRADRSRVGMLIHDSVIVALLAYASGAQPHRAATEAERALEAIRTASRPGAERDTDGPTPSDLAWELQALTTRLDPGIRFDYDAAGTELLPIEVSMATAEALGEALRNSLRHASDGRPVTRQVRAMVAPDAVDVLILDDGAGFEPTTVGAARLGIRDGIVGRMHAVRGGSARVHSAVGYGTTIQLHWRKP
jgi:signal transduction histidine kinase